MNGNEEVFPRDPETQPCNGLIYRDWLAALAMQGMVHPGNALPSTANGEDIERIVRMAYRIADAMIKASKGQ